MRLGKVISCFAGLGCGELALKQCGIETKELYAYEIDKYAEAINRYHNPDTKFLGDITQWKSHTELIGGDVDLIMGGSPCQDLSIAGKGAGLDGARSSLVYVFADMVKYYKPRYFFLENVASMKKEYRDIITELMGVEPILVNSAVVSAQQRERLYWTNIPYTEPVPKSIMTKDIVESCPAKISDVIYYDKDKVTPIIPKGTGRYSTIKIGLLNGRNNTDSKVYSVKGKLPTQLTKDRIKIQLSNGDVRSLSVIEIERLFTLPDDYTLLGYTGKEIISLSKTQRIKMLGNGWVVAVIEQFFKNIK